MHELLNAAQSGDLEAVRAFVEINEVNVDIPVSESDKRSALYFAAANNHASIVEYLLEQGASPFVTDGALYTPLHFAAKHNNKKMAEDLIMAGASLIALNDLGQTAHKVAEIHNSHEVLRYIISLDKTESMIISENIQKHICKIVYENNEGTGFFIDSERNIILTSFHSLRNIIPIRIQDVMESGDPILDCAILRLLNLAKYIDADGYLTIKALAVGEATDINIAPEEGQYEYHQVNLSNSQSIGLRINESTIPMLDIRKPHYKEEIFRYFSQAFDNPKTERGIRIQFGQEVLRGDIYFPDGKIRKNLLQNYSFLDIVPIQITHFSDGTPFDNIYSPYLIDTGRSIPILPSTERPLIEGETVYFAGYPITQREYTFGVGMVTSIKVEINKQTFTFQAPIAPGHSGSPIIVNRRGNLYWTGVVNSEIARISSKMDDLKEMLRTAPEQLRLGPFGLFGSLKEMIDTLLHNLSTGHGTGIIISSLNDIFHDAPRRWVPLLIDFFVGKVREPLRIRHRLFEYIRIVIDSLGCMREILLLI